MGYSSFIGESVSNKIILIEMDLGSNQILWYNYTAGIWAYKWEEVQYNFAIGDNAIGDGKLGYGAKKTYYTIGSVFAEGEEYTEKSSLNDCISSEKSWYYDESNYILYLHYTNGREAQIFDTTVGMTIGLSNKGVYYNDYYYEPRLTSVPTIEKSKDPLYFGIIRFDGGDISFINNDGYFDTITNNYLFGQPVRILFGGADLTYSEFQKIFTGYIEDVDLNYETVTFRLIDDRKKLSLRLPTNQFNKTDYPYLDDDDVGKAIPIAYGEVYNCKVICVNKTQSGANWTFKVCDTSDHSNGIQAIDHVYVDGVEKTPVSTDLSNGMVTINNSDWDGRKTVTVDFKGLKNSSGAYITNPLDIIEDILSVYLSITYDSTNFNTTEWAEAKTHDLMNDIGIFLDSETEITTIIENIGSSVFGNFIVQNDGKYTFRILDTTQDVEDTVYIEQMIEPPQISWDGTQFLTSCKVGYKKDYAENSYRWYVKNDEENEIFVKYKKYISKEFETYLVNSTDAQELAEAIMDYYKEVKPIYTVKTSIQAIGAEIESLYGMQIDRISKEWAGYVKTEVISVIKDLAENTVQLSGRYISPLGNYYRQSPYAINIDRYAINIDEYAIAYGRGKYGIREG